MKHLYLSKKPTPFCLIHLKQLLLLLLSSEPTFTISLFRFKVDWKTVWPKKLTMSTTLSHEYVVIEWIPHTIDDSIIYFDLR